MTINNCIVYLTVLADRTAMIGYWHHTPVVRPTVCDGVTL